MEAYQRESRAMHVFFGLSILMAIGTLFLPSIMAVMSIFASAVMAIYMFSGSYNAYMLLKMFREDFTPYETDLLTGSLFIFFSIFTTVVTMLRFLWVFIC